MYLRKWLFCSVPIALCLSSCSNQRPTATATQPNGAASAPAAREAAEEAQFGPVKKIGNGVSQPAVIHIAYPEFSEQARQDHVSGVVLVGMVVDRRGMPQSIHIIRGVGEGLDEKAVAAVRQYRFKPSMENGQPVAVRLNVEVNFQIFAGPPGSRR